MSAERKSFHLTRRRKFVARGLPAIILASSLVVAGANKATDGGVTSFARSVIGALNRDCVLTGTKEVPVPNLTKEELESGKPTTQTVPTEGLSSC